MESGDGDVVGWGMSRQITPLRVIDRYHSQRQRQLQSVVDAAMIQECDSRAILAPERLQALVWFSLILLIVSGVGFGGLLLIGSLLTQQIFLFSLLSLFFIVAGNVLGYFLILPVHEGLHALAILFWGGRPHFGMETISGTSIPIALYCGARQQLFRRNVYISIALFPLLLLSACGIVLAIWMPGLAIYMLLAFAGNISGAIGDIEVTCRVLRLSPQALIEDTQTGYRAWLV